MYYDDGYEELLNEENEDSPVPKVRAYKLSNGDVIQFLNLLLEYEDGLFHQVEEPVGLVNPYFKRTGTAYTAESLNKMVKE